MWCALKGLIVRRPVSDIVSDVVVSRLRQDDVVQFQRQFFHAGVLLGVGRHVNRHVDVVYVGHGRSTVVWRLRHSRFALLARLLLVLTDHLCNRHVRTILPVAYNTTGVQVKVWQRENTGNTWHRRTFTFVFGGDLIHDSTGMWGLCRV